MAIAPELVAYPMLMGATYAIYRVGRRGPTGRAFEWARLVALAMLLAVVMALQARYVEAGNLHTPMGLVAATLSIAAVFGLVGLHLANLLRAPSGA